MSFQIVEGVDSQSDKIVAKVNHQTHQITATVHHQNLKDMLEKSFQAEIGYDEILAWKAIDEFEDIKSGIWQAADGIHLLGRVHSLLDYGDGKTIVDVYIQNGPEFFTVDPEGVENSALESNDGLEVIVRNLHIYPTDQ